MQEVGEGTGRKKKDTRGEGRVEEAEKVQGGRGGCRERGDTYKRQETNHFCSRWRNPFPCHPLWGSGGRVEPRSPGPQSEEMLGLTQNRYRNPPARADPASTGLYFAHFLSYLSLQLKLP